MSAFNFSPCNARSTAMEVRDYHVFDEIIPQIEFWSSKDPISSWLSTFWMKLRPSRMRSVGRTVLSPQITSGYIKEQCIPTPGRRRSTRQPVREHKSTYSHHHQSIHPIMIPQFNYWPYLHPIIVFAPFPIDPQFHFPYLPYPFPAWYYFQQSMMNIPVNVQPMPTSPSVAPNGESPIAQSINTGSGTSVTNIVMVNDIGNEIGTDNSTNVKIRKNGTPSSCRYSMNMGSSTSL